MVDLFWLLIELGVEFLLVSVGLVVKSLVLSLVGLATTVFRTGRFRSVLLLKFKSHIADRIR